MSFDIPPHVKRLLTDIDAFIEREIAPLQASDDNERFFDHRREPSRTDFDNGGLPRQEWTALLSEAARRADKAGFYRYPLPQSVGGRNPHGGRGMNLDMAMIREHLAAKGLGLFNDLQTEHSVVGNHAGVLLLLFFGSDSQKSELVEAMLAGKAGATFGLTEPEHGSDATWMATRGVREKRNGQNGWRIDGMKMWQSGMHLATHCIVFARTSGRDGAATGITAFIVPRNTAGVKVESYEWTFNMPTDHATVSFTNVWVPESAILGGEGKGLSVANAFTHENRIRQAASSLGAATYCIRESVDWARRRKPFGQPLAVNQGIQFPLVELNTQANMLRLLIWKTAHDMDQMDHVEVEHKLSGQVAACNYWANRLCCQAADFAMQVHGGVGYSRHRPFEHIYRHHRRYRITEGSEQIMMRKAAAYLFGFVGPDKEKMKLKEDKPAKL